jgi:hypothetical protein
MRILGIDPGLAHTGLVALENGRIVNAAAINTRASGSKPMMGSIIKRGTYIKTQVSDLLEQAEIAQKRFDAVVIEDYKDYGGGYKRQAVLRYTTTPIIVFIWQACKEHGYEPAFQDPQFVLSTYSDQINLWNKGSYGFYPGDKQFITSAHKASAAAHAIYYYNEQRRTSCKRR